MNVKQPIIIDCDPGIDDSLALMLALNSPELDILGITVVCGNVPASIGAQNVFKILEFTGHENIPVFLGAQTPLQKPYIDAMDTHGKDGFGEFEYLCKQRKTPKPDAVGFMLETLNSTPKLSIIALGPLTNIAQAIRIDPNAFSHLDRFVSMGGNFRSHGNCSPVAEYNYWCDPLAAKEVFSFFEQKADASYPKIEMVGLDVTRKILLTPNYLEYMKRLNLEIGSFVESLTRFYIDFHWNVEHLIGCVINDPLAVAHFLCPKLCSGIEAFTDIAVDGICEGQSVVDSMNFYKKPSNSLVLTHVDTKLFWSLFFCRLLHIPESVILSDGGYDYL